MKSFSLIVSTPEGNVYEGSAEKMFLRGAEGDLAILQGHVPFVTVVKEGAVQITEEGGESFEAKCGGGILTVSLDETVLLTSTFERV